MKLLPVSRDTAAENHLRAPRLYPAGAESLQPVCYPTPADGQELLKTPKLHFLHLCKRTRRATDCIRAAALPIARFSSRDLIRFVKDPCLRFETRDYSTPNFLLSKNTVLYVCSCSVLLSQYTDCARMQTNPFPRGLLINVSLCWESTTGLL